MLYLPNGIKAETLLPGKKSKLLHSRIQAMPATEIWANGHIPHTDSFYQNIKEYTS